MSTTTYCVRADIESILGTAGVLACIDDNQSGTETGGETAYITDAIERAATEINSSLGKQYRLTDLSGNAWCKWCNAYLAADMLLERRGNPPPNSIITRVQGYRDNLAEAAWGRFQVPEQKPSSEHTATVSNFKPEIGRIDSPIRVSDKESTGAAPEENTRRLRQVAGQPGWW